MRSPRKRLFVTTNFSLVQIASSSSLSPWFQLLSRKRLLRATSTPAVPKAHNRIHVPRQSRLRLLSPLEQLVLPPGNFDGMGQGFLYSLHIRGRYRKFYSPLYLCPTIVRM